MRKIESIIVLGLIAMSSSPVLADKTATTTTTKSTASETNSATSATSASATPEAGAARPETGSGHGHDRKKHEGPHHGGRNQTPGKRQIMALPDLTDKQKSQIQAIYDAKKDQFMDLRKQMQALEADEWQQVQGVLTPAQVQSLGGKSSASAAGGDSDAGAKAAD